MKKIMKDKLLNKRIHHKKNFIIKDYFLRFSNKHKETAKAKGIHNNLYDSVL